MANTKLKGDCKCKLSTQKLPWAQINCLLNICPEKRVVCGQVCQLYESCSLSYDMVLCAEGLQLTASGEVSFKMKTKKWMQRRKEKKKRGLNLGTGFFLNRDLVCYWDKRKRIKKDSIWKRNGNVHRVSVDSLSEVLSDLDKREDSYQSSTSSWSLNS